MKIMYQIIFLILTVVSLASRADVTVGKGWNLLGTSNAISADNIFINSDLVISVWSWDNATTSWRFFTPSKNFTDGGAAYAASKGYSPLTKVPADQGFWINAAKEFTISNNTIGTTTTTTTLGNTTTSTIAQTTITTVSSTTTTTQSNVSVIAKLFSEESILVTFGYYRDGSLNNPVSYIYPKDIDGDGVDEIFFVSFETQPNKPETYSNTSVHMLGWVDGVFKEITTTWFPDNSNEVEGVGDICFGDFNGDGKLDVFLSGYTDMDHAVHPYALMNKGKYFEKIQFKKQTWMHAITCKDINGDGFDDVLVTGYSSFPQYIGSSLGLVEYQGMVGGSGITAGDFLNNGKIQAIVLDADANDPKKDTQLLSLSLDLDKKSISYSLISYLPGPRLDILYPEVNSKNSSHDIRAVAVDFNNDGKLDVVTFGYRFGAADTGVEHRSEIQFLKNKGDGIFEDVTDTIRIDYDMKGSVGYVPIVRDINGDGKLDIFISGPDWFSTGYNSTTLLIQSAEGKFIDSKRKEISSYIDSGGGQATVARGPGGVNYLVKESAWKRDGLTRVTASKIKF